MTRRIHPILIVSVLAVAKPVAAQTQVATVPHVNEPATQPAPWQTPAFSDVLKKTATDVRQLPSVDTVAVLAIGGVAAALGHQVDRALASNSHRMKPWFGPGAVMGGPYVQLGGALATYTIGRTSGSRRAAAIGGDLLQANLVAQVVTQGMKVSLRRSRPDGAAFSFPSGHTSATFAAATVLQGHLGWRLGLPAYAVAAYVGASRIRRKRHYLSDVAFGAAVGIVAGHTVTRNVRGHRLSVTPLAARDRAGISFTVRSR
jgi:membrane-associated phospholipid phosphatase